MMRLISLSRHIAPIVAIIAALGAAQPARATDPLYQSEMSRLLEIMGSLYFLEPLCGEKTADWRKQAADLVALDAPDPDREQRLYGAFNTGYEDYARLHRQCTPAAREAMGRLFDEARTRASDIHSRYAE